MGSLELTSPAVEKVMANVGHVPRHMRKFTVEERSARLLYGLRSEVLAELREQGLPSLSQDGRTLYDEDDLSNVSLYLGTKSLQRGAMQTWASTLEAIAGAPDSPSFRVSYATSGEPPHGIHSAVLSLPNGQAETVEWTGPGIVKTLEWRNPTTWPPASGRLRELIEAVAAVDFWILPDALAADTAFARQNRLLDCRTSARMLFEDCQREDIPARIWFGLLLSPPVSTLHSWVECLVEGVWTPYDPLILSTLSSLMELDAATWPPYRSPGAMLLPLAPGLCDLVRDERGQGVTVSYLTEMVGSQP
ncbi:MAG: transglutaminase domain-containing protein [Chloroflexi bacterium]|nr:transglutaminase domain-containing protein [Chloroflexota bacterium]